jgi:hypothetical protein
MMLLVTEVTDAREARKGSVKPVRWICCLPAGDDKVDRR